MGIGQAPIHVSVSAERAFGVPWHDGQTRGILSTTPLLMIVAGRGFGKTTLMCAKAIRESQEPENAGLPGALLCPTYRQLTRVHQVTLEKQFRTFQETTGVKLLRKFHKSAKVFELMNGAEIWLLSYERYENLRSFTLAWVGVDEITAVSNEEAVLDVVLPAVRGEGTGRIWFCNTPRGLKGIVKTFVDEVRAGNPDYQVIHGTSYDNSGLDRERIDRMRKTMGRAQARQEIDAVLLRPANLVYSEFSRSVHLKPWRYSSRYPYSFWVDWGDSHPSYLQVQHNVPIDGVPSDVVVWQFCDDDVPWARGQSVLKARAAECDREPEEFVGDRAVRSQMQWAAQAFPQTRTRKMETREDQEIWRGVQIVKWRLEPEEGPPRLYFASNLAEDLRQRGIISALEQYKRCLDPVSQSPIDKPYKDNVTDHANDALRMGVVARYGGAVRRDPIRAPL
ncbi:MAG: hypothetical protein AMXMBFR64_05000 [Myxococcales bacterium]